MSLSTAILNLPAQSHKNYSVSFNGGYKFGHRDCAKAAAELAGKREAELISAIEGLLDCISGTGEPDAVLRAREVIR
jgi:hypothetical protein